MKYTLSFSVTDIQSWRMVLKTETASQSLDYQTSEEASTLDIK